MLPIPSLLQRQFEEYLQNQGTTGNLQGAYKKWLRYYLDFCDKYNFPPALKDSLPHFIRKLHEKKQTEEQQRQAVTAVRIYTTSGRRTYCASNRRLLGSGILRVGE